MGFAAVGIDDMPTVTGAQKGSAPPPRQVSVWPMALARSDTREHLLDVARQIILTKGYAADGVIDGSVSIDGDGEDPQRPGATRPRDGGHPPDPA